MTLNQKVEIYRKLVAGLAKGVKLAALLDRLGKTTERRKVEQENDKLAKQAQALRQKIHKDWQVQAKAILTRIQQSSTKLQTQIRGIEQTKQTGQRVVSALGHIDDLIQTAKTIAGAMA